MFRACAWVEVSRAVPSTFSRKAGWRSSFSLIPRPQVFTLPTTATSLGTGNRESSPTNTRAIALRPFKPEKPDPWDILEIRYLRNAKQEVFRRLVEAKKKEGINTKHMRRAPKPSFYLDKNGVKQKVTTAKRIKWFLPKKKPAHLVYRLPRRFRPIDLKYLVQYYCNNLKKYSQQTGFAWTYQIEFILKPKNILTLNDIVKIPSGKQWRSLGLTLGFFNFLEEIRHGEHEEVLPEVLHYHLLKSAEQQEKETLIREATEGKDIRGAVERPKIGEMLGNESRYRQLIAKRAAEKQAREKEAKAEAETQQQEQQEQQQEESGELSQEKEKEEEKEKEKEVEAKEQERDKPRATSDKELIAGELLDSTKEWRKVGKKVGKPKQSAAERVPLAPNQREQLTAWFLELAKTGAGDKGGAAGETKK